VNQKNMLAGFQFRFFRWIKIFISFWVFIPANVSPAAAIGLESTSAFADSTSIIISISLKNNQTTKDHIIFREILPEAGDTIIKHELHSLLEQSRLNLLNTGLFNFVEYIVETDSLDFAQAKIEFIFTERWYLWPVPAIELGDRNFNEWWNTRDFSRWSYGLYLNHNNFRGRRELLQALVLFGYKRTFALNYIKPNLNREQTFGMGFSVVHITSPEVVYATKNDKPAFFQLTQQQAFRNLNLGVMFYFRPQIHETHSVWLQYTQLKISHLIFSLNPEFYPKISPQPSYLSLIYEYRRDFRNLKYYPTQGYYFDLLTGFHGTGLATVGTPNILNLSSSFKKYHSFNQRWYLLGGGSVKASFPGRNNYFLNQPLGYMYDFVRGYEHYIIDGKYAGLVKANLKYQVLQNRIVRFGFIRSEKFNKLHLGAYLGLHTDAAWVHEPYPTKNFNNRLQNKLLMGHGLGLDVVTYYDRVLRLEYSVNRMGEHGLFVHFLAPI
jgi:outer membrane protein assembly factor BamA